MYHHHIQFFTATNLWWKKLLLQDKYKDIVIDSLRFLVEKQRVKVHAFVIMPNHIHLMWRIDKAFLLQDVQRDFLKFTAQQIKFDLLDSDPELLAQFEVNLRDRRYQFWERNPLSIDLYSPWVLKQKLRYIHRNPLQERWKLVDDECDYWYSSARFYSSGIDDFGFLTHYQD
ncbi:transposase [Dyadobacter sp. CY323]|uniref:transposase n=1 Tax=Dyadobacter sp. CY323 TaxID=2907302 RepID=UPI001F22A0C4|nr:transposase [Dyadobacter sp. CY323]MCE6987752.1 transposase [Dyadobacter sp. CY323]